MQVFEGNTHDHQTVPEQIDKLKRRFGLSEVVLVADRGMVTRANLEGLREHRGHRVDHRPEGSQVKKLARGVQLVDGAAQAVGRRASPAGAERSSTQGSPP